MKKLITSHFIAMIAELLSSEHSIGDYERAHINSAVNRAFDKHGTKTSISKVAKLFADDPDARIRAFAAALAAAA